MPQKIQLQQIALAADRPLVSDVSLTLRRGQVLALLGSSGSGKSLTCAAALDTGAVTRHSSFYCGESISVAGTRFHCANHKRHGAQTVTQALENSCNQSFIQSGARLGKEAFCSYFAAFGLREPTGIDLPNETRWTSVYNAEQMAEVDTNLYTAAFGQNESITPMQMAEKMSYNPAKILHLDKKGSLAPGMAADVVVIDPEAEYVIDPKEFVSKGKNTPFGGKKVKGKVMATVCGGKIVYEAE